MNNTSVALYKQGPRKNTLLFSTYDAQYIFDCLIGKLEDRDLSVQAKPDKWKLTYEKEKRDEEDLL